MAIEIRMPGLSQTTDDVRLVKWHIKEGDEVQKGDPICEVETDKTTMDVESFERGNVLKLYVEPDTVVTAGTVILVLGEKGERVDEKKVVAAQEKGELKFSEKKTPEREVVSQPLSTKQDSDILATPLVRNIARKKNIDLRLVRGTGPQGLVTKRDIEAYIAAPPTEKIKERVSEYPLSRNQVLIAQSLAKSKSLAPHYYLKTQIFVDSLIRWREQNQQRDGTRVSVYAMFINALAKTLIHFPKLNGYYRDNKLILFNGIHIGFAISVGEELYVPVIKDAITKEIGEIDREVKWLVAKAQNEKLEAQDISGSTFTITNLGMFNVDEFYAIINPPQAGILTIGQMRKNLYIDEKDSMSIRDACTITGSFDHRIVNGAQGAAFIERFKRIIEEELYRA